MMTIKDVADAVGLSTSQIRRRLSRLNGVLRTGRGSNNSLLVEENAVDVLRRFEEIHENGATLSEAAHQITEEVNNKGSDQPRESMEKFKAENEQLKERVKELKLDKEYLKDQIKTIEAKLPAAKEQEKPEATPWELFKNWLFKPQ